MDNREFFERIHLVVSNCKSAFAAHLAPVYKERDLAPSQIGIIRILNKYGSKNIGELSKMLCMPDSNVSAICRKLEQRDLLQRVRDDADQRIVNVNVTPKARALFAEMEHTMENLFFIYLDAISDEDKTIILAAMEKLDKISQKIKADAPLS